MNTTIAALDGFPFESAREDVEDATDTAWLRAKRQEATDAPGPDIAHARRVHV